MNNAGNTILQDRTTRVFIDYSVITSGKTGNAAITAIFILKRIIYINRQLENTFCRTLISSITKQTKTYFCECFVAASWR